MPTLPPEYRFYAALGWYAFLAVLAGLTLDGPFRFAVWVFLGGLGIKTWIAHISKN